MTVSTSPARAHTARRRIGRRPRASWLLRAVTAAALVIDAVVHLQDAHFYDVGGHWLSEGDLFRIEAVVALAAALLLLVWPTRASWVPAFVVAATAGGAALLFTYADIGPVAGLPNLYEPSWAPPGKTLSATAEGIGALLALTGLVLTHRRWFARTPDRHVQSVARASRLDRA
jgi:hypothetical protein